jgi:hypothetical protein
VLAVRLGCIQRVSYNLTTWDAATRRITVDGRQVRLGGFHSQHTHTVDVIGPNQPCLTLLVIPPETGQATAHQILMKAARRENIDTVEGLLTPATTTQPVSTTSDLSDAVQRWEADGGRAPEPDLITQIPRPR